MTSPASQTGTWAPARAKEGLDKVWRVDARWWDLGQGCRMWYVGEAQSPGGPGEQGWPHHQSYGADGRDSKWRDTVTADKVEAGRRETVSRRVLSPWGYEDCSSRWPVFSHWTSALSSSRAGTMASSPVYPMPGLYRKLGTQEEEVAV